MEIGTIGTPKKLIRETQPMKDPELRKRSARMKLVDYSAPRWEILTYSKDRKVHEFWHLEIFHAREAAIEGTHETIDPSCTSTSDFGGISFFNIFIES